MKANHERPRRERVSEPVQVYLERHDRDLLDRLTTRLGASKSDVLRRALAALERQLTDPAQDPILGFIALADLAEGRDPGYDVAREHDRFLAESEEASWRAGRRRRGR
ncbi:MAG: ribbon-helix-helix protein, CopG family [Gemmatimonadales bacterium]|jgi:Arc/MetJ-type ribon-helix-helix transcriptional regulator